MKCLLQGHSTQAVRGATMRPLVAQGTYMAGQAQLSSMQALHNSP